MITLQSGTILLSHGFNSEKIRIDKVNIREVNGYDETLLHQNQDLPLTLLTTLFLSKISSHPQHQITENIIRELTLGDRNRILLTLRKISYGEIIDIIQICTKCNSIISFEIPIDLSLIHIS